MNPALLDTLQGQLEIFFGSLLTVMSNAAFTLFTISVLCGLAFYCFAIVQSMRHGGGAVLETLAFRIFIIMGLTALVVSWPSLSTGIRNDISNFAAHVAKTNTFVLTDFTPSGVLRSNDALTNAVYAVGAGNPLAVLSMMQIWKVLTIAMVQFAGGILALDLFFANISLYVVFGTCSFLMGFIINPWLSGFTQEFIKLIVSTAVYIILIGAFVSVGQSVAETSLNYMHNLQAGVMISGVDMMTIGALCFSFALLAVIVPAVIATRIGGGIPLLSLGGVVSSVRSGMATFR